MNPWENLTAEQRALLAAQVHAVAEGQSMAGAMVQQYDVYQLAAIRRTQPITLTYVARDLLGL